MAGKGQGAQGWAHWPTRMPYLMPGNIVWNNTVGARPLMVWQAAICWCLLPTSVIPERCSQTCPGFSPVFLLTMPFPSHSTQSVQGAHKAPCCLVQARPLKTKPTFSFLSKHSFVNGSAANGLKGCLETSCVCRVAAATAALPHRHRALAGFYHPSVHLT